MPTTQRLPAAGVHYRPPNAVAVCALDWGCLPSTARQRLNPSAPESPWRLAAVGTAALYRAGLIVRAETLCGLMDRARVLVPAAVTRERLVDALLAETRQDGLEDEPEVALIDGLTPGALDTWLRRARPYAATLNVAIRIAEAYRAGATT